MPLTMLGIGKKAKIIGLNGKPEIKKFLAELGFIFGKQVEVLQYTFGNNIIIGLGDMRMALDRKIACYVEINPEKEELCQPWQLRRRNRHRGWE